jgi:hypothetical protein
MWKTPGYAKRVEETLERLVGHRGFHIAHLEDVNLIGAAVGALTP